MNVIYLEIDEFQALIVLYLLMDALGVIMVDHEQELPPEINHGAILLADELLQRVWPSIGEDRLGEHARALQVRVANCAACVRRDYHFVASDMVH